MKPDGRVIELGGGRIAALAVAADDVPRGVRGRSHSACMTPICAGQGPRRLGVPQSRQLWAWVGTIAIISRNVVPSRL